MRSLGAGAGLTSRAHGVPDVAALPRADRAPSWRKLVAAGTSPLEALRLPGAMRRLRAMPRGDGHVVIDIPGWQAPEASGLPLRRYLAWLGYDARGWTFGKNLGDPARVRRVITYGTPVVGGPTCTAVAGTYTHEAGTIVAERLHRPA
jgi:hypothetical protein